MEGDYGKDSCEMDVHDDRNGNDAHVGILALCLLRSLFLGSG